MTTPRGPTGWSSIRVVVLVGALAWFAAAAIEAWKSGNGADVVRQWVVCQYVRAGENPYALSLEILHGQYGSAHETKTRIWSIPREVPSHLRHLVLPDLGPPEATYPPSAIGLLSLLIGWLPSPRAVLVAWLGVNLVALVSVVVLLSRLLPDSPLTSRATSAMELGALLLPFTPFFSSIARSQFSLPVLAALVLACRREAGVMAAGLGFTVALLKPSIALPFLLIPAMQRRWAPLLMLSVVHGVAALGVGLAVGASPLMLTGQWLAVSRYFLQGMYSIQDVINAFDWRSAGPLLSGLTLVLACGWSAASRHAEDAFHFAFLGVVSVLWTYHGLYDLVFLLPALMVLMGWRPFASGADSEGNGAHVRGLALRGTICYLMLALALLPLITAGTDLVTRLVRWGGRLVLLYAFIAMGGLLWRASRRAEASGSSLPTAGRSTSATRSASEASPTSPSGT